MTHLGHVVSGVDSLVKGMSVTIRNMFRRPVTELYPHQKPELPPAFRSAITLVQFDATGTHDCIACMLCVRICPSYCIEIEGIRHEGVKGMRAEKFDVDYALCSVCGLCLDVCPTDTLGYSRMYDVVGFRRDGFVFDLLEEFRADEAAYVRKLQAEHEAARAAKRTADARPISPVSENDTPPPEGAAGP